MGNYNQVYTDNDNGMIEIQPEYLYLTIPAEYACTYHKLLVYLADFGKSLLDDCSAACKNDNRTIIECWNLFQSAVACRTIGQDKQANLFIDYINKRIDKVYKDKGASSYNGSNYYPITPDGQLKALLTCGVTPIFEVDVETGELYQKYLDNKDNNETFTTNESE